MSANDDLRALSLRRPLDVDHKAVRLALMSAYGRQEWGASAVSERLAMPGVHRFDPGTGAYCHVEENYLHEPLGPIPTGLCSHVATLGPQLPGRMGTRAYLRWATDTLAVLLLETLEVFAAKNPNLLHRPFYAIAHPTLIPVWARIVNGNIHHYDTDADLLWQPTLQVTIDEMKK